MNEAILNVSRLTVRFGGLTAVSDVDFSIFPETRSSVSSAPTARERRRSSMR